MEKYKLSEPTLLPKPTDLPESYIAYNPSGIWTVESKSGKLHDIMYVRVEPDRSCPSSSHLGKSRIRPYVVDVNDFNKPPKPYHEAEEKMGEDPALTRVKRRLGSGAIETVWLLSCVDAQPYPDQPDRVMTLHTKFFAGEKLDALEHIADGPEGMKDIRISRSLGSTALHIYGRPHLKDWKDDWVGNITHRTIAGIEGLTAEAIADAEYIDRDLFPSGVWGGVNDVVNLDPDRNLLIAHRAWLTGEKGRHYETVLFNHDFREKSIIDLGVLATADMFPTGKIKNDEATDMGDVVFPGGGYNGNLVGPMTLGVYDGSIGFGRVRVDMNQDFIKP